MVSRRQRQVWSYVEEGKLLRLKMYFGKHRDLNVNFSHGRRERSPLHLACSLEDDAIMQLLLKQGADVLLQDRKGNTALHVAANRAVKHGKTAYLDLVLPLVTACPEAMDVPNRDGVTPKVILGRMKCEKTTENVSRPSVPDPEKEWAEHLFNECMDEMNEIYGAYDDDDYDEDEEDFGNWADRIHREYCENLRARLQMAAASFSGFNGKKSRREREREEQSNREQQEKMRREHEEYLQRAARKEEETRRAKKRRYEEACTATFDGGPSADSKKLSYNDIPWPVPRGTVQEMLDVMLHGVDRKDVPAFRKLLRKQQARWHPDRFVQRCGARLDEKHKQRVLDTVTALSQGLNSLAQSLKP